jgi:hypothetical protein
MFAVPWTATTSSCTAGVQPLHAFAWLYCTTELGLLRAQIWGLFRSNHEFGGTGGRWGTPGRSAKTVLEGKSKESLPQVAASTLMSVLQDGRPRCGQGTVFTASRRSHQAVSSCAYAAFWVIMDDSKCSRTDE